MQGDIVSQGLELMLFGMGTVLVFLTVLVIAIGLMSKILTRYFPVVETVDAPQSSARGGVVTASNTGVDDPKLIAVISAAIHRHRTKK